jgi:hypothetical protein
MSNRGSMPRAWAWNAEECPISPPSVVTNELLAHILRFKRSDSEPLLPEVSAKGGRHHTLPYV